MHIQVYGWPQSQVPINIYTQFIVYTLHCSPQQQLCSKSFLYQGHNVQILFKVFSRGVDSTLWSLFEAVDCVAVEFHSVTLGGVSNI